MDDRAGRATKGGFQYIIGNAVWPWLQRAGFGVVTFVVSRLGGLGWGYAVLLAVGVGLVLAPALLRAVQRVVARRHSPPPEPEPEPGPEPEAGPDLARLFESTGQGEMFVRDADVNVEGNPAFTFLRVADQAVADFGGARINIAQGPGWPPPGSSHPYEGDLKAAAERLAGDVASFAAEQDAALAALPWSVYPYKLDDEGHLIMNAEVEAARAAYYAKEDAPRAVQREWARAAWSSRFAAPVLAVFDGFNERGLTPSLRRSWVSDPPNYQEVAALLAALAAQLPG